MLIFKKKKKPLNPERAFFVVYPYILGRTKLTNMINNFAV